MRKHDSKEGVEDAKRGAPKPKQAHQRPIEVAAVSEE